MERTLYIISKQKTYDIYLCGCVGVYLNCFEKNLSQKRTERKKEREREEIRKKEREIWLFSFDA